MTETTSIPLVEDRQTYVAPLKAGPGVMTFMAQATIGFALGCFVLVCGSILREVNADVHSLIVVVPLLSMFGAFVGAPVGLIIWLFNRFSDRPLKRTFRVTIALLLLASGYFALLLIFSGAPTSTEPLRLIRSIVMPGIAIGLLTGSSLRVGRELVRGGEAVGLLPRILAGVTGLMLRVLVVLLFMASVIVLISTLQSYYLNRPYFEQIGPVWVSLAFGHFALGMIVLFARVKFEVLFPLTAIANAPLLVILWRYPNMPVPLWYVLVGYLSTWAMFLGARWRQTDVALAALKQELRYYLID